MRFEEAVAARTLDRTAIRVVQHAALGAAEAPDVEIAPGMTVLEAIRLKTPTLDDERRAGFRVVSYEGADAHVVPIEHWTRWKLKPGAFLVITDPPMGSGLRSILQIVVAIAALVIATALTGPLGLSALGTALLGSALAFAGNFLLNLVIPLRTPKNKKDKETYSLSGLQNQAQPDAPFPLIVGLRHRYAPPYLVPPYIDIVDGKVVLSAVFACGFAPMAVFKEKIGERLITRFQRFEIERRGFADAFGVVDTSPHELVRETVIQDGQQIDIRKRDDGVTSDDDNGPLSEPIVLQTAPDTRRWKVIFSFPRGLNRVKKEDSKASSQFVWMRIRQRPVTPNNDADWVVIETQYTITSKKTSAFFIEYEHDLGEEARGAYEVEFTRTSDDAEKVNEASQVQIIAFQSIKPEYPINSPPGVDLATVAVRIQATNQLQGNLDAYNGEFASLIDAWNATTGAYDPMKETGNPADWYRRLETMPYQPRPVTADKLNQDEITAWHAHNVAQNLTFSRPYDGENSIQDVILDVCHAGRAVPRMINGIRGVSVDQAKDELGAYPLTPHNSWGFEGKRTYGDFPEAFRVKFKDRTNEFKDATREVPRPGFAGDPTLVEILEPPGLTDPVEAYRFAYLKWLELLNRPDTYTVNLDWETRMLQHGMLVLLMHRVLHKSHQSGFVKAVAGKAVSLSEPVKMEAGKTYAIKFRALTPDGSPTPVRTVTWPVKTAPGETQIVELQGARDLPKVDALFGFGESAAINVLGIIQDVEPMEKGFGRLTVVPYAGDKIFPVMDALVVPPYNSRVGSALPIDVRPPPIPTMKTVDSSSAVYQDGETIPDNPRRIRLTVEAGFGAPTSVFFDVRHRKVGEPAWRTPMLEFRASDGSGFILTGYAKAQQIEMQPRAKSRLGIASGWGPILVHSIGAADVINAPKTPEGFAVTLTGVKVSASLRAAALDDRTASLEFRRGTPAQESLTTQIVNTQLARAGDLRAYEETPGPGAWRYWGYSLNESQIRCGGPAGPVDITIPGVVFSDTFNRSNGAPGASYTIFGASSGGVVQIVNNQLSVTNATGAVLYAVRASSPKHAVQFTTAITGSNTSILGVVRAIDESSFIGVRYLNGQWEIVKFVDGAGSVIATYVAATPATGTVVKLTADGTLATLSIAGAAVATATFTDVTLQTSDLVGFRSRTTAGPIIDNLQVEIFA